MRNQIHRSEMRYYFRIYAGSDAQRRARNASDCIERRCNESVVVPGGVSRICHLAQQLAFWVENFHSDRSVHGIASKGTGYSGDGNGRRYRAVAPFVTTTWSQPPKKEPAPPVSSQGALSVQLSVSQFPTHLKRTVPGRLKPLAKDSIPFCSAVGLSRLTQGILYEDPSSPRW